MMSTIKNINVAKDFSGKYDFLLMGAQDGVNKFSPNDSFSNLSNESIQMIFKGEKKIGSDKKKVVVYNNSSIKKISIY